MNPSGNSGSTPLTDVERLALRPEIDADALSELLLRIDSATRQFIMSHMQLQPPPRSEQTDSARDLLADEAATRMGENGPIAFWIEFADSEQNRLWRKAVGVVLHLTRVAADKPTGH